MVPVMRIFALVAASFALWAGPGAAQSALLESAKALCAQLRQLNAQGVASNSPQAVSMVAREQNLSPMDAEVLTTYVVGLHCPDVR